jgi:hypothetical protein
MDIGTMWEVEMGHGPRHINIVNEKILKTRFLNATYTVLKLY